MVMKIEKKYIKNHEKQVCVCVCGMAVTYSIIGDKVGVIRVINVIRI